MKTIHSIDITDEYLKDAQRLVLSQQTFSRLVYINPWFSWLPPVLFAAFLAWMAFYHVMSWPSGVLFGSLLIISIANQFFKPRTLARARNRNPLKGSVVRQSTDENGIDSVSTLGDSHLHWSAIARAVVYPNGVLLKLSTRGYIWLPDGSLIEGAPEDVRKLVTGHVKEVETSRE